MTAVTGTVPDPKSQTEGNGATVKTRELGRTDIRVSPYCLGTMMSGQVCNPEHDDDVYGPHGESDERAAVAR